METSGSNYISNARKLFHYYKALGERAIEQISDEQIHWQYNKESNSTVIVIKHIAGNSLLLWSDLPLKTGNRFRFRGANPKHIEQVAF